MSEIESVSASSSFTRIGAAGNGVPADPRLWKAAQEFETVLMSQLLKAMRATERSSDLLEECAGREVFDQMFSEAIAKEMVESNSLGMTRVIYHDLGGRFRAAAREAENAVNMAQESPGAHAERTEEHDAS